MINNCIQIPMIDNFFCHYQYTIQVLIAIGTIGSLGSLYNAFGGSGTGKAEGGILSAKKMAKGGVVMANCGASMKPTQKRK